jgi:hypothetical protein
MSPQRLTILYVSQMPASPPRFGAQARMHGLMTELIKSVARRVVDRNVLRLIKMWLRASIEERDADETRRMSGGKRNTRGTPQGGVASPLLANIYMNRFLKHWRLTGCGDAFQAHVVFGEGRTCGEVSTRAPTRSAGVGDAG